MYVQHEHYEHYCSRRYCFRNLLVKRLRAANRAANLRCPLLAADHQSIKACPFGCCCIPDCLERAKVAAHKDQARTRLPRPSLWCASQAARRMISAWVWPLCTFVGLHARPPVSSTRGSKHSALACGPSRHEKLFHCPPDLGAVTWTCRGGAWAVP